VPPWSARSWIVGIMGGGDHGGRWRIASRCTVVNPMGGADLDLTDAIVEGPETEIHVFSLMGGSNIFVPDGVHVELSGFAFMGGNELLLEDRPAPPAGAPVVRARATRSWEAPTSSGPGPLDPAARAGSRLSGSQ
jgi:hypothetical protein